MTPSTHTRLKRVSPLDIKSVLSDPVDPVAKEQAGQILRDVERDGEAGLLRHAVRLGDIKEGLPAAIDE